jgi:hypothetical protein
VIRTRSFSLGLALASLALSLAACSDRPAPFAPVAVPAAEVVSAAAAPSGLLVCPSSQSQSASAVIGPKGGVLYAGRTLIAFPPGAVPTARRFTLTVPASRYLEIEVHAAGAASYSLAKPVTIAMDYSRCPANVALGSVGAWYIDSNSKSLLQWMGGVDQKLERLVVFQTDHFSGYALAE